MFHPDGKHLLSGDSYGIRRWRLEDGQEVGRQTGTNLNAISVSRDHQWVVCGTTKGASVWDAEIHEKVTEVEATNVIAVDVSPDSTRFATGTAKEASIWSITSGERLVGPLRYAQAIRGLRFSPNNERIATSYRGGSICVFDSYTGDELMTIMTITTSGFPSTPLAWSNNGQQIFTVSNDKKIKSFNISTGTQLAESHALDGSNVESIALAANGMFIATYASRSITFLDTTTLSQIDPVIKEYSEVRSIALSPNSGYLASGLGGGKITVLKLGGILPDMYGPFHVSICALAMLPYRIAPFRLTLTLYIRHLARKDNQTSSLRPRMTMTTNHSTLR